MEHKHRFSVDLRCQQTVQDRNVNGRLVGCAVLGCLKMIYTKEDRRR